MPEEPVVLDPSPVYRTDVARLSLARDVWFNLLCILVVACFRMFLYVFWMLVAWWHCIFFVCIFCMCLFFGMCFACFFLTCLLYSMIFVQDVFVPVYLLYVVVPLSYWVPRTWGWTLPGATTRSVTWSCSAQGATPILSLRSLLQWQFQYCWLVDWHMFSFPSFKRDNTKIIIQKWQQYRSLFNGLKPPIRVPIHLRNLSSKRPKAEVGHSSGKADAQI